MSAGAEGRAPGRRFAGAFLAAALLFPAGGCRPADPSNQIQIHGHASHDQGPEDLQPQEPPPKTAVFYGEGTSSPLLWLEGGAYEIVSVPTLAEARRLLRGRQVLQIDYAAKTVSREGSTASAILVSGPASYRDNREGGDLSDVSMEHGGGPAIRMHQPARPEAPLMLVWVGGPSFPAPSGDGGRETRKLLDLEPVAAEAGADESKNGLPEAGEAPKDSLDREPQPAPPPRPRIH